MSSKSSRLRVVGPEQPPRRSRRPGAAVVAVLVYALLFGLALWYLRVRWMRSHSHQPVVGESAAAPASASQQRAWLLGGAGLAPGAREELGRRLAVERCDCGCELALRDCLAQDRSCARSPELGRKIAEARR